MRYYQTETGRGAIDDPDFEFPPEWTEITEDQYNALVEAERQAAEDAVAAAVAEANARWTTVHDDLIRVGVSEDAAVLLANGVGTRPA